MRLKDKVAVITGASRGIGKAIALEMGKDGAKVIVNYAKNVDGAAEVVEAIRAAGSEALAVQADVSTSKAAVLFAAGQTVSAVVSSHVAT